MVDEIPFEVSIAGGMTFGFLMSVCCMFFALMSGELPFNMHNMLGGAFLCF